MKGFKITFIVLIVSLAWSCAKSDQYKYTTSPNARLVFSTDTIQFDTVFTSIGSSTQEFLIYNSNKNALKTTLHLAGGKNSPYRLNIDGLSGQTSAEINILGKDSIFGFIEVNVDPQNANSPVIIRDSLTFYTNGNYQDIKLIAYGQDVHLLSDEVLKTQTWNMDKPYLIRKPILVDSTATLTIDAGSHIYFDNNASLWIAGSLKVNGTKENPVTFEDSRTEPYYNDIPGQWGAYYQLQEGGKYLTGGLHFWQGSYNNHIKYAIIKNGIKGIQVDFNVTPGEPTLILENSIIKRMSFAGLYAQTAHIEVSNSVIADCGYHAVVLNYGGDYTFLHSTIANYYPSYFGNRETPSLILNNYYLAPSETGDLEESNFDLEASFGNCIIYGDRDLELQIDTSESTEVGFNYLFENCMIKASSEFNFSDTLHYLNTIANQDSLPRFMDIYEGNYRLDTLSAAKDKGSLKYSNVVPLDLDEQNRTLDNAPDLGAYERIENGN